MRTAGWASRAYRRALAKLGGRAAMARIIVTMLLGIVGAVGG